MPRAKPALNINVENSPVSPWLDSPDFSPTTASSAPLTPADSSPHIFASKQLPPNLYYTPHISGPYSSQQSLLEHSPTRHGFRQSPTSSQFQHDLRSHALYSQAAEQTALSTFKPFADQPSSYPSPAASSHIAPLQPSSTLYQSPPSDILSRHSPPAISSRRFDGYSPSVGLGLNMPSTMGELSNDWKVNQPRTPPSGSHPFPSSGDWIRGDMDPTPRSLRRGLPAPYSSGSIDDQFSVVPGRSFPAAVKTSPTASFSSAHEVSTIYAVLAVEYYSSCLAYSLLTFFHCFTRLLRRPTTRSSPVSSSLQTSKHLFSCNKSSRSLMLPTEPKLSTLSVVEDTR